MNESEGDEARRLSTDFLCQLKKNMWVFEKNFSSLSLLSVAQDSSDTLMMPWLLYSFSLVSSSLIFDGKLPLIIVLFPRCVTCVSSAVHSKNALSIHSLGDVVKVHRRVSFSTKQ
jgi:hypothetical protein